MRSVQEVLNIIPAKALADFQRLYGEHRLREYIEAIRLPRTPSFRLNSLKTNRLEAINQLQKISVKFREYSLIPGSFQLLESETKLSSSKIYGQGHFYLQGLSGMLPSLLLPHFPGATFLDLAAAPGSKTTHIQALAGNKAIIHALEPDFKRMEKLKKNCQILGVENIFFHQVEAERMVFSDREWCDGILADVPCSGEGRFNLADTASYGFWRPESIPRLARLQLKILLRAAPHLRPEGILVYSTCTMNAQENEEVIEAFLKERQDFRSLDMKQLNFFQNDRSLPQEFSLEKKGTISFLRIFPSRQFEGFFISVLGRS